MPAVHGLLVGGDALVFVGELREVNEYFFYMMGNDNSEWEIVSFELPEEMETGLQDCPYKAWQDVGDYKVVESSK